MKTNRPQRVYIIVRDPDSGTSKTLTLYDITFEKAVSWLRARISETVSQPADTPNPSESHGGDNDKAGQ